MRRGKISIDIFDCVVYIYTAPDIYSLFKLYERLVRKHELGSVEDGLFQGAVIPGKTTNEFYLLLSEDRLGPNLISHECSHLCQVIFEFNNIDTNVETESFALLTGWINEKVTKLTNEKIDNSRKSGDAKHSSRLTDQVL
jgi:hypothetical protein